MVDIEARCKKKSISLTENSVCHKLISIYSPCSSNPEAWIESCVQKRLDKNMQEFGEIRAQS